MQKRLECCSYRSSGHDAASGSTASGFVCKRLARFPRSDVRSLQRREVAVEKETKQERSEQLDAVIRPSRDHGRSSRCHSNLDREAVKMYSLPAS